MVRTCYYQHPSETPVSQKGLVQDEKEQHMMLEHEITIRSEYKPYIASPSPPCSLPHQY